MLYLKCTVAFQRTVHPGSVVFWALMVAVSLWCDAGGPHAAAGGSGGQLAQRHRHSQPAQCACTECLGALKRLSRRTCIRSLRFVSGALQHQRALQL